MIPVRLPLVRPPGAPRPSALTNNIHLHRLKNKFGTKILPTAELSIQGAEAYLLGEPNQGVKLITPVLNITRTHSAMSSVAYLRKPLAIATAHSHGRAIKGGRQLLKDTPLHVAELAKLHVLYRALVHFVFGSIVLLGKNECGVASESEGLRLRLLTPAIKAFAAEKCVTAMEECMTMLGGEGYMEENGIARCVRGWTTWSSGGSPGSQVDSRRHSGEDMGGYHHGPISGPREGHREVYHTQRIYQGTHISGIS